MLNSLQNWIVVLKTPPLIPILQQFSPTNLSKLLPILCPIKFSYRLLFGWLVRHLPAKSPLVLKERSRCCNFQGTWKMKLLPQWRNAHRVTKNRGNFWHDHGEANADSKHNRLRHLHRTDLLLCAEGHRVCLQVGTKGAHNFIWLSKAHVFVLFIIQVVGISTRIETSKYTLMPAISLCLRHGATQTYHIDKNQTLPTVGTPSLMRSKYGKLLYNDREKMKKYVSCKRHLVSVSIRSS